MQTRSVEEKTVIYDERVVLVAVKADEYAGDIKRVVEECGCRAHVVNSYEGLMHALESSRFVLLIIGVLETFDKAVDCIMEIRIELDKQYTSIMFFDDSPSTDRLEAVLEAGCREYVSYPLSGHELSARIKVQLKARKVINKLAEDYAQLEYINRGLTDLYLTYQTENSSLRESVVQLEEIAQKDSLTGLYTRRFMVEKLVAEVQNSDITGKQFAVMLCDIDSFKAVNDNYGHNCGDKVLKAVGNLLITQLRKTDIVSRWGGEEFLILLPYVDKEIAMRIAEKLRSRIQQEDILYEGTLIKITITIGVTLGAVNETDIYQVINRADQATYVGKQNGKNQVNYLFY